MRHENLIISKTVAGRRNGQLIVVQEVGGDQLQKEPTKKTMYCSRNRCRKMMGRKVVRTVIFMKKTSQGRVSTGKAVADMARIFSTVIIGVSFMSHG